MLSRAPGGRSSTHRTEEADDFTQYRRRPSQRHHRSRHAQAHALRCSQGPTRPRPREYRDRHEPTRICRAAEVVARLLGPSRIWGRGHEQLRRRPGSLPSSQRPDRDRGPSSDAPGPSASRQVRPHRRKRGGICRPGRKGSRRSKDRRRRRRDDQSPEGGQVDSESKRELSA